MPSLENLRKQAKLILRWHRERYYPVAAQIRAVLPHFAHLSDREILAHAFKLSDAQEMVARQAGFDSWQAPKSGIDSMPDTTAQTATRPTISETAAQLFVADIKASCDFFTQKLGFAIEFVYGEPPFYVQVWRDGARLNMRCVDTAEEIKQLYLEFQSKGVTFAQTLRKEPWGARTFIVKDLDGNLLLFAGPGE